MVPLLGFGVCLLIGGTGLAVAVLLVDAGKRPRDRA
jgi:hypothetical protein